MLTDPQSSEDGVYHVYALPYAQQMGRRAKDNFMLPPMAGGDPHDGPMPVSYYIWIIRNRFRTIVVDTGISQRASVERGRKIDIDPVDALSRIGIDADAVEDVIITHLHFDHASNLHRFGRAQLHVQEAEAGYVTGRCMCEPFLRAPFDVEDVVMLMRRLYSDQLVFHDGDVTPFPGISLHLLPGHSAGLQAVCVVTPRGPVVLASDATHYYANLLQRHPFRVTIDVPATLRSYRRLMRIAGSVERIVPGHDPKVRSIYPRCEVNGVELIALHEPPMALSLEELVRFDP